MRMRNEGSSESMASEVITFPGTSARSHMVNGVFRSDDAEAIARANAADERSSALLVAIEQLCTELERLQTELAAVPKPVGECVKAARDGLTWDLFTLRLLLLNRSAASFGMKNVTTSELAQDTTSNGNPERSQNG